MCINRFISSVLGRGNIASRPGIPTLRQRGERMWRHRATETLCPAGSELLTVTGVVGGRVVIKCSFNSLDNHIKYFCKRPCLTESDVIIKTRVRKNYFEGRYSINDFGNGYFNVTIKDLERSDYGTYWCGVERDGVDSYQKVYLSVEEAPTTPPDITRTSIRPPVTVSRTTDVISTEVGKATLTTPTVTKGRTTDSNIDVLVSMGAGLVVVVCLLVLLLLIFLRQRNRSKTHTGSCPSKRKTSNPIYSTSANQHSDTHDINSNHATATNQCQDDIYCNVDSSTEALDSVSYATVNFPRDPSCLQYDTVNFPRDPSCVQYDTVNFPRDPSCVQYDTVNFPRDPSCLQYDTVNFPRDPSCLQYDSVSFSKDSDVSNQPDSVTYSTFKRQHSNHEMVTYSAIKPKCSQ
ncbi:uncharacterized protein LOC117594866 [Esox lucius]|uniref:uncharacterized protein LOC117594866 n=1 Tax=Esox lucius TaxID=8010 RepID=UPI001476B3B4|nr:uncharacterized protein LOC117594866 [Esox lucius]